jgi:methylenetetrahydrofolate reductase (NADPH)
VEFFPPKTEEGARQILKTAQALQAHGIAFASITYGAGGSTRERTIEYGELLQQLFHYRVVPHLTCVGHTRDELAGITDRLANTGFTGIMALRGDPPRGETEFRASENGLAHASELVALIRKRHGGRFTIGVAGYPGKHPEAPTEAEDMKWLAHKVAQGADFITTQLFFDNAAYFPFASRCRAAGITIPIIPGILPITSLEQALKFCHTCGAALPAALGRRLTECGTDAVAAHTAGIEWACAQVRELLARGVPGFHLYILNRARPALELLRQVGLPRPPGNTP